MDKWKIQNRNWNWNSKFELRKYEFYLTFLSIENLVSQVNQSWKLKKKYIYNIYIYWVRFEFQLEVEIVQIWFKKAK